MWVPVLWGIFGRTVGRSVGRSVGRTVGRSGFRLVFVWFWGVLKNHEHVFDLKTGSEPYGQALEDLPQGLFDVLDPFLRVLKLELRRC